jgi:spore germination protein PC
MGDDLFSYLRKLHVFIEGQERRIRQLESDLQRYLAELKELKEKPAIRVDRIEYKFDQLKVETLEGTLNIGLNPSDLQGIEDLSVGSQAVNTSVSAPEKMRNIAEIEDTILNYVETDTEKMVTAFGENLQRTFDPSYVTFIKQDIKKQLPNRIDYYINQIPPDHRSPEPLNDQQQKIIEQLKAEIEKGIYTFLSNLPELRKE